MFAEFSNQSPLLTVPYEGTNFAKIAIFAKIASLQGAAFGIQFKSPAAGDFSPVSPFSPLHAFLDISDQLGFQSLQLTSSQPDNIRISAKIAADWGLPLTGL